ncbi:hypothetical protein GM3708_2507 [Geminocystis sp. NIES-3708]|uniref:hypothetical protein n=1 Tax=Geminocystis sp. NIES-3708 TaxID=1615909 RepID=UPI0005FC6445|nr:hypothetical protein [Geminocystis sp. NIES-3708]BAQ62101.1 hypothetical protein GM3708_2507 [Geminocystis sp. NIES-3708]
MKSGISKTIVFLIFLTINSSITNKVYADVDDCIDSLVDRGTPAREAREACSKVMDNNQKTKLTLAQKMCFSAQQGNGETLRYQNGQVMTYGAGRVGSTWYYPNGQVMTYGAGRVGSTWYYPNGQVMTYNTGNSSATWYYPNGQVMTYNVGNPSATWYNSDGSVLAYRGHSIPLQTLLYPCNYIE